MTVNYAVQKLKVHKTINKIIIIMITTIKLCTHWLYNNNNNYYYYYSGDKNPGDADTAAGCIIAALQQLLTQYSFTRSPSVMSPNAIISSLSSKCNTEKEKQRL